jgi:hypothetical protein
MKTAPFSLKEAAAANLLGETAVDAGGVALPEIGDMPLPSQPDPMPEAADQPPPLDATAPPEEEAPTVQDAAPSIQPQIRASEEEPKPKTAPYRVKTAPFSVQDASHANLLGDTGLDSGAYALPEIQDAAPPQPKPEITPAPEAAPSEPARGETLKKKTSPYRVKTAPFSVQDASNANLLGDTGVEPSGASESDPSAPNPLADMADDIFADLLSPRKKDDDQ